MHNFLTIESLKKSKNKDVSHAGLLMRRASIYRMIQRLDLARADADEALKLEPNNFHLLTIRANWARQDGLFDSALADYDAAIALKPSASVNFFFKGLILKEKRDFRGAIEQLDRAIELEPNNAEYYCSRGRLYTYLPNLDSAIEDLNTAVAFDPQNSDFLHWRGRIHRDRQECFEAMRDFESALKLTGDDIDYAWRGIMHSHLRKNVAALEDVAKAISLAPNNSFHYQFQGIINFGLDNAEVALESMSKAIELMPTWAGHYVWRAAVLYEGRDMDATMADLDKAVQLRSDEVSLFWRALAYLDVGEIKKAQYDLEAAYRMSSSPISSRIPFWRGVVALLQQETEISERFFTEATRLAADERKAGKYCEPARISLLKDKTGKTARDLYREMFDADFTVDNPKTEHSHLFLLSKLFPENNYIKKTLTWFEKTRKNVYLPSVTKPPSSPLSSSRSSHLEESEKPSSMANNPR